MTQGGTPLEVLVVAVLIPGEEVTATVVVVVTVEGTARGLVILFQNQCCSLCEIYIYYL